MNKRAKRPRGVKRRSGKAPSLSDEFALIDSIPAVIWRADLQMSQFSYVSGYAETLLGYPLRRWTDEPAFWDDHVYPEDREIIVASRANATRESGGYDLEYRMVAADGRLLWVRELARVVPDGGQRAELAGVIVDLTHKRSAERALDESKLWLRQVIDTIPQQIWSGAVNGSVDFCNARWRSELGLTLDEVQGDGWQKILHPDDRDRVLEAWRDAVANGTPYEQQERHRTADGSYRWFLCRGVPLRDHRGSIVRWFGTNTDIELQKRAEDDLRTSEQRWRAIFDNAWVGVGLMDSSLHFLDANAVLQKMTGYTLDELRSITCLDLTHEDDRRREQLLYNDLLSGKRARFEIEQRYRRKDGDVLCARSSGSILPGPAGQAPVWVVVAEDITERKRLHHELQRERDWLRLLLDLTHQFIATLDLPNIIDAVLGALHQRGQWEWSAILLPEPSTGQLKVHLNRGGDPMLTEGTTIPVDASLSGKVYRSGQPVMFRSEDLPALSAEYGKSSSMHNLAADERLTGGCVLPLLHDGHVLGVLFLATRSTREFAARDLDYLQELAQFIAAALSNAQRYGELSSSHERLAGERNYIEAQVRSAFELENIIGRSKALRDVLRQVHTVAPSESAVLVLGETGTGKELIARAIHDLSSRRDRAFIKIDCPAIPANLLESELFGYERGAFTGALEQKLGRLEIADKGTLFLDEVGEIPLELQTKLLRVLQDQAIERLGSNRTRRLDVRVIAATNRDLEEMVQKGEFRADLYYRLKVFPITIPPLRDRRDDIPPLVWHYVRKYAQRMRKFIDTIPGGAMDVFRRYSWPGNVRELQHFMERSVVITSGNVLQAPLRELEQLIRHRPATGTPPAAGRTMEEIERESILQALRDSNWVVGGPRGAAAKLGLKRTTLASRMERLGISLRRR